MLVEQYDSASSGFFSSSSLAWNPIFRLRIDGGSGWILDFVSRWKRKRGFGNFGVGEFFGSFAMYSVAQTSVGVGGVDAHRVPYCARRSTCRARKKTTLEIKFRVSQPNSLQAGSLENWQPHYRIWNSFGVSKTCCSVYYFNNSEDYLSTRSGRIRVSVSPGAQVPGDVSLVTETTVREEESIRSSGFVEAAEVEGNDVVAFGYGWKVREASRFDTEELRAVAHVQASSFHLQTAVFDELFFKLFKVSFDMFPLPLGRQIER